MAGGEREKNILLSLSFSVIDSVVEFLPRDSEGHCWSLPSRVWQRDCLPLVATGDDPSRLRGQTRMRRRKRKNKLFILGIYNYKALGVVCT